MLEERLPASAAVDIQCAIFDKFTLWAFSPAILNEIKKFMPPEVDTTSWDFP
jgi:hypothetical protein